MFKHSCRTFSHTVAVFLGVEESYLKIAKNFLFAERPKTSCDITIKQQSNAGASYFVAASRNTSARESLFKVKAAILLSEKE